jgi:hypothetical protein
MGIKQIERGAGTSLEQEVRLRSQGGKKPQIPRCARDDKGVQGFSANSAISAVKGFDVLWANSL